MIGRPIEVPSCCNTDPGKNEPSAPPAPAFRHCCGNRLILVGRWPISMSPRRPAPTAATSHDRQVPCTRGPGGRDGALDGRRGGCDDADPVMTWLRMRYSGGVGRVRFGRLPARRATAPGAFPARALPGALVVAGALAACALVVSGGPALADVPAAPLAGSSSAMLTQVNAAVWQ